MIQRTGNGLAAIGQLYAERTGRTLIDGHPLVDLLVGRYAEGPGAQTISLAEVRITVEELELGQARRPASGEIVSAMISLLGRWAATPDHPLSFQRATQLSEELRRCLDAGDRP